jgi:hypothetical protein
MIEESSVVEFRDEIEPNLRRQRFTMLVIVAFIGFALLDFAQRREWMRQMIQHSPLVGSPISIPAPSVE